MIINDKENENTAVSQAWNLLYHRLEKDGLLPAKPAYTTHPIATYYHSHRRLVDSIGKVATAAILIACIFSGWYFLQKTDHTNVVLNVLYNEAHAPTLATMLEDGSVVYLSGQSSLKYPDHFDANKREVILRGDAFFEIKSIPACPFIIQTDVANIEVTGTSFKIKSDNGSSFLLSVREGEVKVTQHNRQQTLTVKAGETVFFDSEQLQLQKSDVAFDEYFKRIHFKDERLNHVATIINLHSDSLQLKVDPTIAKKITCTFELNSSLTEIAAVICKALDLHLSLQDQVICISE